jgi:non-ribosomal peptide synthetase component F
VLDDADTVLQKTPFSFDVSVWEFFWPLMTGARLVWRRRGASRARLIDNRAPPGDHLHFVPSMLQVFVREPGLQRCHSVRQVICSGEALAVDTQQQVFSHLPGARLPTCTGRPRQRSTSPTGPVSTKGVTACRSASRSPTCARTSWPCVRSGWCPGGHGRADARWQAWRVVTIAPGADGRAFRARPVRQPRQRLYRTGDLARYRPTA